MYDKSKNAEPKERETALHPFFLCENVNDFGVNSF